MHRVVDEDEDGDYSDDGEGGPEGDNDEMDDGGEVVSPFLPTIS